MDKAKIIAIAGLFLIAVYAPAHCFGSAYEECLNNFDIAKADFEDSRLKEYYLLLKNYFLCKAVRNNDPGQCDSLGNKFDKSGSMVECKNNLQVFNKRFRFYSDVYFGNFSASEIEGKCMQEGALQAEGCHYMGELISKKSPTSCPSENTVDGQNCMSYITLNPMLASDIVSRDRIFYLLAYKNRSADICTNISESDARGKDCDKSCMYLLGNNNICEADKDFVRFRDVYCRTVSSSPKKEAGNE